MSKIKKEAIMAISVLVTALILSSCASGNGSGNTLEGKTLYTQMNMWAYGNVIDYVNYSVDMRIPVNTQVTITERNRTYLYFVPDGSDREYALVLNSKYASESSEEIISRSFSDAVVDLGQFTAEEQDFIRSFNGFYKPGISKAAMLVARGYPPSHRTPSIDADEWIYWRNRWKNLTITFEDGVSSLRNGVPIE